MDYIIKILESLEKSALSNDGAIERVESEIKSKKVGFLGLKWHLWLLHW